MTINAPSRSVVLVPDGNGRLNTSNPTGSSGGSAALFWSSPGGLLNGSAITVSTNGTYDFGSKATAAPYAYFPMIADADGQTGRQIGLEQYNSDEAELSIVATNNFGSHKSLHGFRVAGPDVNSGFFPHIGKILPDSNDAVFLSYFQWLDYDGSQWTNGSPQIKVCRAGRKTSDTDGAANYAATGEKILPSLFIHPDGTYIHPTTGTNIDPNGNSAYIISEWVSGANTYTEGDVTPSPPPSSFNLFGQWVNVQAYYHFGTIGGSDGIQRVWLGGKLVLEKTNMAIRTGAGQDIDHIQVFPGLSGMRLRDWHVYLSRIYIDTTQARVFLGNASTIGNCTGFFVLPPTAWSSTSVTATISGAIPSGYNWLYVTSSSGTTTPGVPLV